MGRTRNLKNLSEKEVNQIIDLLKSGKRATEIAPSFNIDPGNVSKIARRYRVIINDINRQCYKLEQINSSKTNYMEETEMKNRKPETVILDHKKENCKSVKLTDNERIQVAEDLEAILREDPKFNRTIFANQHNISVGTLKRIALEFSIDIPDGRGGNVMAKSANIANCGLPTRSKSKENNEELQQKKKEYSTATSSGELLYDHSKVGQVVINTRESTENSTVAHRGNLTVNVINYFSPVKYATLIDTDKMEYGSIFGDIYSVPKYSSEKCDKIVQEYLSNNIKFDKGGIGITKLSVYIPPKGIVSSTLTMFICALTKNCVAKHVNLSLFNYNNKLNVYEEENILDIFKSSIKTDDSIFCTSKLYSAIMNEYKSIDSLYTYNCDINDICINGNTDVIVVSNSGFDKKTDNNIFNELFIVKNLGDVWDVVKQLSLEAELTRQNNNCIIEARKLFKDNGNYVRSTTLFKFNTNNL